MKSTRTPWVYGLILAMLLAVVGALDLCASGTLTSQIALKISATGTTAAGLGTADDPISLDWTQNLASGTGANQSSNMFHDRRTLAPSGTESLDLAGSLTNRFGTTLTFTKIKAVGIKAAAANTNSVQVTRPASNGLVLFLAASDGFALTPGAFSLFVFPDANGVAVTAATGDLLTITNSAGGTSVTYDIFIFGVD